MKTNYCSFAILILSGFLHFSVESQNPCTGTPGANTIIPSSATICAGSNATLALANNYPGTSGITYQWGSSNVSIVGPFSTIQGATMNTFVTPSITSTMYYNVVITCTNTNQSINISIAITVVSCATPCNGTPQPTVVVPASQTICPGNVVSMSLASTYSNNTGITFQWGSSGSQTGPYTAVSGATLSSFTSSAIGTNTFFNVVVTCTNSGNSYTATSIVSVVNCTYCSGVPAANTLVPNPHTVCVNSAAAMSLANSYTVSGIVYQWGTSQVSLVGPFTNIPGATASTYTTAPLTGTPGTVLWYNVIVTCTNSSMSNNFSQAVTIVTCAPTITGIDPQLTLQQEFVVFPNPNSGEITIKLNGNPGDILSLIDLMGRNVFSVPITDEETKVSVQRLPAGLYYAELQSIQLVRRIKILKE